MTKRELFQEETKNHFCNYDPIQTLSLPNIQANRIFLPKFIIINDSNFTQMRFLKLSIYSNWYFLGNHDRLKYKQSSERRARKRFKNPIYLLPFRSSRGRKIPIFVSNLRRPMRQIWHKWSSRGQISLKFSRTFSQLLKTLNIYLSTLNVFSTLKKFEIRFYELVPSQFNNRLLILPDFPINL